MEKITAHTILKMLEKKHDQDVFVPECKDGATWGRSHNRLDAWTMNRSWSNMCFTGYEIKVSRGDFLQDSKYTEYLPTCNKLYFVCPPKMIGVSEIPLEVGLMYTTKNGTGLMTKKKAVHREIEVPKDLLLYVLMSRVKVCDNSNMSTAEYWSDWVKSNRRELDTGRLASKKIRKVVNEKILLVGQENSSLRKEQKRLEDTNERVNKVLERLSELGITHQHFLFGDPGYAADLISKKLKHAIPKELLKTIKNTSEALSRAYSSLTKEIT